MGLASRQTEPSSFAWRWPVALQGIFILLILITLPFLPESPCWLVQRGRIEEATDVLARLRGSNAAIRDSRFLRERDELVASVREEQCLGQASWAEVFTEGKDRNISRVLLGAGPYLSDPQLATIIVLLLTVSLIGSINGLESTASLITCRSFSKIVSVFQVNCLSWLQVSWAYNTFLFHACTFLNFPNL